MTVKPSAFSQEQTVTRLLEALERRGLTVFARIDHAAAASAAGLELPNEEVLIFGNPKAGTLLMQSDRRIGIELPLRILVWQDGPQAMLEYSDPRELADAYDVSEQRPMLEQMATLLEQLAVQATS